MSAMVAMGLILLVQMPGSVTVVQCDGTQKIVGENAKRLITEGPVRIDDIEFSAAASDWDRERVKEILKWSAHCWYGRCITANGKYDPPPPPMKCPPGEPVS